MTNYELIIQKIQLFIRKYHTNELIKGSLLFLSIGLMYFFFTLFVEYFLWLKPLYRTILFWIFIAIELFLLYRFILIPIFRLSGIYNGITTTDASKIIGKYFPEIDDKLLNVIQLHQNHPESELVLASIDQKSLQIKPFKFQNAIEFKRNKKYIKYLGIPLLIWLFLYVSGNQSIFSGSYDRLVHHQKEFIPPAPFYFKLLNKNLTVIEGNPIDIQVSIVGNTIPEEAYIVYQGQKYFLNSINANTYSYRFENIKSDISFHFEGNIVASNEYNIKLQAVPQISNIEMLLQYPTHINKAAELITNTGNANIPEGTVVTWKIQTKNTTQVLLNDTLHKTPFVFDKPTDKYILTRSLRNNYNYTISTSNQVLKNFENLPFSITVIKDAHPEIQIETDIDSLQFGEAHFVGRLTDDYGISKLQLVYYPLSNPNQKTIATLPVKNATISDFYYVFPNDLNIIDGKDYEFYFEVFDNDKVNSFKSTKSVTYSYHKNTELEENQQLLEDQNQNIKDLYQLLKKQEKNQTELDLLEKQLKNKSEMNFNETQQIQQLLKRQQQYEEMMQQKTEQLKENIERQPDTKNEELNDKKDDIQKRIDELKQSEKEKQLLEELQKLSEKLKKEELIDKVERMSTNNKQKEKSLEQLLELTKRFYVEQKMQQLSEKIEELAKKQEHLKEQPNNNSEAQNKLNEEFNQFQKEMQELIKENEDLKQPMNIDEMKPEQENIKQDMQQASEQLDKNQKPNAQKKQQAAANKMHQMSKSMQQMMMEMQGEMIEEDIAALRRVIENLITFSYKQEDLMETLKNEQQSVANFSSNLKKQNQLKTYFEHIDDSLYTLSMRQAKLSKHINDYLSDAHYYLKQSNESLSENQIPKTRSNQQFVMTAANDLAALLSSLLDNMQNPPPAMGQGKGKGSGQSFSLPDIIQKQGELKDKMQGKMKNGQQQGEQQGEQKGENEGKQGASGKQGENGKQGQNGEQQSKELYEIYKQQAQLREALEKQLENLKGSGTNMQVNTVLKQMEQLEQMLLEKGITNDVLQRMMRMEHELLKLKNATYEQGKEEKRVSNTNQKEFNNTLPKHVQEFFKRLNQQEILNRESIPFQPNINQKIIEYFKK